MGGEGGDRRWDGWMASPTWWSWVWASCGSWWWIGKPGVLQSIGLQRVRLNWTECEWASSNPLWAWMEQKAELGEFCVFLPVSHWTEKYYHIFSWNLHLRFPWFSDLWTRLNYTRRFFWLSSYHKAKNKTFWSPLWESKFLTINQPISQSFSAREKTHNSFLCVYVVPCNFG